MIWAILALVGVPLWLCALGILTVVACRNEQGPALLGPFAAVTEKVG